MADYNFVTGAIFDPVHYAESLAERKERGDLVMASQQNEIPGAWSRAKAAGVTKIVLREAAIQLLGKHRRPHLQRSGTCVSRGFAAGIQTSLDWSIVKFGELLRPETVIFAPIYSLARIEVGKGRVGWGDGAMLCDAAKAVHDYGVATDKLFDGLTEDEIERLAVKFAAPNTRTPAEWIAACKGNTVKTFAPDTLELIYDCIASGYAVPYGSNNITGMPNADGIAGIGSRGGHCRCFTSVIIDHRGRTRLGSTESWGRFPAGQPQDADQTMDVEKIPCITVNTIDGPYKLPPGEVAVDSEQFWDGIQSGGEAWCVGSPQFKSTDGSLTDLVRRHSAAA